MGIADKIFVMGLLVCSGTAMAATLLIDYDVTSGWNGTQVVDAKGFSGNLTPGSGSPRTQSGPNLVPADFGAPVRVASGAAGSTNRAYLSFQQVGTLTGSNRDGSSFSLASGYTMEGYFFLPSTYTIAENTGLGFSQGTSYENQFIMAPRGTSTSLQSQTSTYNTSTTNWYEVTSNINSIIPRDAWFDIMKVYDPSLSQVRYYINGVLKQTDSFVQSGNTLWSRGESWGNVGTGGREVRGFSYAMTRFYDGVLTNQQILDEYTRVVPEPASLSLLTLAGLALLRRRK